MIFPSGHTSTVGIDLGATNVKMICLKNGKTGLEMESHGFIKRKNGDQLKKIFQSPMIKKSRIRVNIEDASMKIRKADVPPAPKEELEEIIKWSMRDVLGSQTEDFIFRWTPLPKEPKQREESYLVYALKRESIQNYLKLLKELGLKNIDILEPNISALYLALQQNYPLLPKDRYVIIDMGSTFTHFSVSSFKGPLFSRPLGGMAGESLTKQISRNLGIDEEKAEELKIHFPNPDADTETQIKLKNTISHYHSKAALEIQLSIDAYLTQFPLQNVTKIFFTGGGAHLAGLMEHIEETLNILVEKFEPFQKVGTSNFRKEELNEKKYFYALAYGLALQ